MLTVILPIDETIYSIILENGYHERVFAFNKYYLIDGTTQKYNSSDLNFEFSGMLGKLKTVKINNKELINESYTLESGSTIVKVKTDGTVSVEYLHFEREKYRKYLKYYVLSIASMRNLKYKIYWNRKLLFQGIEKIKLK